MANDVLIILTYINTIITIISSIFIGLIFVKINKKPLTVIGNDGSINIKRTRLFDKISAFAEDKNIELLIDNTEEGVVCNIVKNNVLVRLFNFNEIENLKKKEQDEFFEKIKNILVEENTNA